MTTDPALENRFLTLLNEHRKIIYKVSSNYTRDYDSRRDLEQEIVIHLWRSFGRYDETLRFSTWMYRIALNVAISAYRTESRRSRHFVPADESILSVPEELSDQEESNENLRRLHEFIGRLVPLDRALVILYLDGHSYAEIADVIGISESNVGTKLGRIKARLKRDFDRLG